MKDHRQKAFWFLLGLILITLTLFCAEAELRIAAQLSRQADIVTHRQIECFVRDTQGFIVGGNPYCAEHDARGYRSRKVLSEAQVVTLGDSLTYGAHVSSDAAWPQVLSQELSRPVYNMALSGTGPLQTVETLRLALQLHPKMIIFGFFFDNDLVDDFIFAKEQKRLPEFLSAEDIAEINKQEDIETLEKRSMFYLIADP